MARARTSKINIAQVAETAAGYALGEGAARGIMQIGALDENKRDLLSIAVPGIVGFLLMQTSKSTSAQNIGAGMLGTGVVRGVQLAMDKLGAGPQSNGFSRVNTRPAVQEVVANALQLNGVGSGSEDNPHNTTVTHEVRDGHEFTSIANNIDGCEFYNPAA